MPPRIDIMKCDGCMNQNEALCVQICPGDLMYLGKDKKAKCRKNRDCWDCMSCIKVCPKEAIELKLPYQLGYHGAKLIPKVGQDKITWIVVDINGKVERFTLKTRNKGESDDK